MKTVNEVAASYIGEQELPQNSGFKNEEFAAKMIDVGFQKGQAWCSYFGELCCVEALPNKKPRLSSLFHASAVQTFKNFIKAGYTKHMIPMPGYVGIYQTYINGVADWTGHLVIVNGVDQIGDGFFQTIEGNTNDKGGREGYIVAPKTRKLNFDIPKEGRHLVLLGFINPDEL